MHWNLNQEDPGDGIDVYRFLLDFVLVFVASLYENFSMVNCQILRACEHCTRRVAINVGIEVLPLLVPPERSLRVRVWSKTM